MVVVLSRAAAIGHPKLAEPRSPRLGCSCLPGNPCSGVLVLPWGWCLGAGARGRWSRQSSAAGLQPGCGTADGAAPGGCLFRSAGRGSLRCRTWSCPFQEPAYVWTLLGRRAPGLWLRWENRGKIAVGTLLNIWLFASSCSEGTWNSLLSFFEDLEKRHQENLVIPDISDIVEEHASKHFNPYVSYCSNEVYQQRTLQKLLWVLPGTQPGRCPGGVPGLQGCWPAAGRADGAWLPHPGLVSCSWRMAVSFRSRLQLPDLGVSVGDG